MRRFWNIGLLGKTVLAVFLSSLLPLATLSFQMLRINREALLEQVLRTHAVASRTTAARIEAFLGPYKTLGAAVAASQTLLQSPKAPESLDLLSGLLQARPEIGGVCLWDAAQSKEVVRIQRKDWAVEVGHTLEAREQGMLTTIRLGQRLWCLLRIGVPETADFVELAFRADALAEILKPYELGDEAEMVLMGEGRQWIEGSVGSLEGFPNEMLHNVQSNALSGAGRYLDDRGNLILAAYSNVAGTPWQVLSRQPSRVAEEVAWELGHQSFLAIGMASVLTLLLSLGAYRGVVRPLRELLRVQRRWMGPSSASSEGRGELDQLRSSLEVLEKRVKDREELGEVFLGRFQVLEVLGSGAMGSVFRGWDPKLQRVVALKTVRLGKDSREWSSADLHKMLLNEAVAIARLNHPNIVAIYDVADSKDAAFLAMEFVEGKSLADLLNEVGILPLPEIAPLGAAIATGLAAAHAAGVIHQDVKPGNLMLGKAGSIKLMDFGIARCVQAGGAQSVAQQGTPGFLPPEFFLERKYGEAGDLFALGVILYRCLTGIRLFLGTNLNETIRKTLHDPVTPLTALQGSIPAEMDSLILQLLEKRPEERPAGALQVAEAFEELCARHGWSWTMHLRAARGAGAKEIPGLETTSTLSNLEKETNPR